MPDYYEYALTSDEDCCLMMMIEFFEDLGLPEDFNQTAFDSLSSKFYNNLKPQSTADVPVNKLVHGSFFYVFTTL